MGRTKTKPFLKRKKVPKLYFHFWSPKKCPPFFFLIHTWWCENITASPCGFNVRSSAWKNLNIFSKRQISIKLFYLYQRLEYRHNYFFKMKFAFFLYWLLSALWNENDLPLYISDIRQILRYRTSLFIQPFPWRIHITITYNLPHLRIWNADVVTIIT
jgi:hypothetical protein